MGRGRTACADYPTSTVPHTGLFHASNGPVHLALDRRSPGQAVKQKQRLAGWIVLQFLHRRFPTSLHGHHSRLGSEGIFRPSQAFQIMIAEPFSLPGRFWRGNLHTHSTLSDGARPVAAVVGYYKRAGYDFLMLSDHFLERFD